MMEHKGGPDLAWATMVDDTLFGHRRDKLQYTCNPKKTSKPIRISSTCGQAQDTSFQFLTCQIDLEGYERGTYHGI
eukprot:12934938-Prorocentrum_lima.AAC.1